MFDAKRLQILVAAARRGSFAAAADELSFTPSAISQQISTLEAEVGAVLFERTSRGVRPTDAGRVLLVHAEVVLAQIADARAELDALGGVRAGRLGFGSFSSATSVFAARAVDTFRTRHPGVALRFADGEPYESVARLKAREVDLAVTFDVDNWDAGLDYDGERIGFDNELRYLDLFDDPYHLVLPPGHRLAATTPVDLAELAGEAMVGGTPWYPDLDRRCARVGVELHLETSYRATGFEAFQAFVAAGWGLTLMPRLALGWLREGLVERALVGGPVRHVRLATLAHAPLSPATRAMIDIVGEHVNGLSVEGATAPRAVSST